MVAITMLIGITATGMEGFGMVVTGIQGIGILAQWSSWHRIDVPAGKRVQFGSDAIVVQVD
jgi:hypothetical protein